MAPPNKIPASSPSYTEARLFEVANRVALKNAQEYQQSTWHSWNIVFDADTKHQFGIRDMDRSFWTFTGHFGSCLGASTRIYTQLQDELSSHPDMGVRCYSNNVRLMTTTQHATKEIEYQAVVAICFDDYAIVIAHEGHPAAFSIPLGGTFDMTVCPLYALPVRVRFRYVLAKGKHRLTMEHGSGSNDLFYFSETDVDKATNQIAIPATEEMYPVKGQEHILMPSPKYLSVRSLLKHKPNFIPAQQVEKKWLATTVRIQVKFDRPEISMSVLNDDWLKRCRTNGWYKELKDMRFDRGHPLRPLWTYFTPEVAVLTLPLNAATRDEPCGEMCGLAKMQNLAEEFGLHPVVLGNMVWSLYRVWAPHRCKRADSIIAGEMSAMTADA